jgi:uncharacterized ferritin-like protein (DUF455 family)
VRIEPLQSTGLRARCRFETPRRHAGVAKSPDERWPDVCRRNLDRGDLSAKHAPAPAKLSPAAVASVLPPPDRPARDAPLAFTPGADRLPRPAALAEASARAACLARFANHELMAVELFAWALLRWPELPDALREGWLAVLADEQRHCRLYLARLAALGSDLADHPRSDYFWRQADTIASAPQGPRAFLAVMGLTLEQANLDFTGLYADAFRAGGDEESAAVCDRVHEEEIGHVAMAALWIRRLSPHGFDAASDVDTYLDAVPFPFGPHRAKGRRFDAAARRRAGLSERFIEPVEAARSTAGGG